MLKKYFFRSLYILTFLVVIINTVFAMHDSLSPDINDLPDGVLKATSVSPDGDSRVDISVVDCSLGTAVKGVYVKDGKSKNVYWQTDQTEAAVKWIDRENAVIGGISLDLSEEVFDSRFSTAIFSEGLLRRSRRNEKKPVSQN